MKPRGIPIAQIDSNTENDAKLQRLARTLPPERYYAAFGAYMGIVLKAWGRETREPDDDYLALLPEATLGDLKGVGLVDGTGALPEDVYERRVAPVLRKRDDTLDRLSELAQQGGKARASGARRDAGGRLVPSSGSQPDPLAFTSGSQPDPLVNPAEPAGASSLEESRGEERNTEDVAKATSSGAVAPFEGAVRSPSEWTAYLVDRDASRKDRMTRWGEFYAYAFSRPIPDDDYARLGRLLKEHPGGVTGLANDILGAGLLDVKGDPLDYITAKVTRGRGRGAHQRVVTADRDKDIVYE